MKSKQAPGFNCTPSRKFFEVTQTVDWGYEAKAMGYSTFTQGVDCANLKETVLDAGSYHFADGQNPESSGLTSSKAI